MKIAFFNWRDIHHPLAGGAEAYCHQLLKRFVAAGHQATMFSSVFAGCREREIIDGVEHLRYGGRFRMYLDAYSCYRKHVQGRYDVIIESINGMPLFLPRFAREPVVPFIHQLTRENWYSGLPFPLAFAGYHLEDHLLRVYRDAPAIVPSDSTRQDLEKLGFRHVRVVNGGTDIACADAAKERAATILYLGRLTKSKRVDHVLRAFRSIKDSVKDAKLWVAGSGPDAAALQKLSETLKIAEHTTFYGRVGEADKVKLLSRAHLVLFPAVREGWGIVVLEANACGTPVIGYDVQGLRDSIKDGVNGYLVASGDADALSRKAVSLLADKQSLRRLSTSSANYSKRFTWDRSAEGFLSLLQEVVACS